MNEDLRVEMAQKDILHRIEHTGEDGIEVTEENAILMEKYRSAQRELEGLRLRLSSEREEDLESLQTAKRNLDKKVCVGWVSLCVGGVGCGWVSLCVGGVDVGGCLCVWGGWMWGGVFVCGCEHERNRRYGEAKVDPNRKVMSKDATAFTKSMSICLASIVSSTVVLLLIHSLLVSV